MKRIKLTHGTARVEDNISDETIEALNRLSERAFEMKIQEDNFQCCSNCDLPDAYSDFG